MGIGSIRVLLRIDGFWILRGNKWQYRLIAVLDTIIYYIGQF